MEFKDFFNFERNEYFYFISDLPNAEQILTKKIVPLYSSYLSEASLIANELVTPLYEEDVDDIENFYASKANMYSNKGEIDLVLLGLPKISVERSIHIKPKDIDCDTLYCISGKYIMGYINSTDFHMNDSFKFVSHKAKFYDEEYEGGHKVYVYR